MDSHVTIDLSDKANASELAEAEVGDCVYLRVVEKTGDSIVGTVEQIEPMETEDVEGEVKDVSAKGYKGKPKGVTLIIAA